MLRNEQDAEDAFQAVFLVLAKRSHNVRWQNCIANWLYGVALRIARREQKRAAKISRMREKIMIEIAVPSEDEARFEELECQLYQELEKLPDKYRAPVVLCDLEGKTRLQAAVELGVSELTVKGRLERGRKFLRKRLAGNGAAALTLLSGGVFSSKISQAAITQPTIIALTKAATSAATASTVGLSLASTQLAKGEIMRMTIVAQAKVGLLALCAATGIGMGAFLIAQTKATPQAKAPLFEGQTELEQRDAQTKRNLHAIAYAIHAYVDEHNGELPPAEIPNVNLSPERRLSGLVLLLPYLGVRPSYLPEDDPDWKAWHADNQRARAIYASIDLTKAWDDPANAEASKTIVPEFLSPSVKVTRDDRGRAVSHFALVRGSLGRDNGMFPLGTQTKISIPEVRDGTVNTIAVGQINSQLGPWIAAGASTARFVNHPSTAQNTPGFGSEHKGAAYFAFGDSSTYFLDMQATDQRILHAIAGRDDMILVARTQIQTHSSAVEWSKHKKKTRK